MDDCNKVLHTTRTVLVDGTFSMYAFNYYLPRTLTPIITSCKPYLNNMSSTMSPSHMCLIAQNKTYSQQ